MTVTWNSERGDLILDPQTSKPSRRTAPVCDLFFHSSPGDNNTWSLSLTRIYTWHTEQPEQGILSFNVYRQIVMLGAGNPAMFQHPIQERVQILLVTSCCRNGDKLQAWLACSRLSVSGDDRKSGIKQDKTPLHYSLKWYLLGTNKSQTISRLVSFRGLIQVF